MNITIHVTARGAKRLLFVGAILVILGTAAASFAVPVTFQSGTVLKAADLNQDFAAATSATHGSKTYSLGAVFKKATQPIYTGNLGGYSGAKTICESAVGTPTAHMCTADELVRSAQLGIDLPATADQSWYASGTSEPGSPVANDCLGWTNNTTAGGAIWRTIPATQSAPAQYFAGTAACSADHAVLCCD